MATLSPRATLYILLGAILLSLLALALMASAQGVNVARMMASAQDFVTTATRLH